MLILVRMYKMKFCHSQYQNINFILKTITNYDFLQINRDKTVIGLREGTEILIENDKTKLIGDKKTRVFRFGIEPIEVDDQSFHI